jgi:hypothetical protein
VDGSGNLPSENAEWDPRRRFLGGETIFTVKGLPWPVTGGTRHHSDLGKWRSSTGEGVHDFRCKVWPLHLGNPLASNLSTPYHPTPIPAP